MYKNGLQMIVRSHECVMDGVENLEGTGLWTVFSTTEYGGKYQNDAAILVVKKNKEVIAKTLEMTKGQTQWAVPQTRNVVFYNTQVEDENDLRNRPLTPPRNGRR